MYNEHDLKKILSRAIELQNKSEGSGLFSGYSQKLSLQEIEEIARESGLSPEYVRQAAVEMEGVPIEESFFLDSGSSTDIELVGFAEEGPDPKTWAELRAHLEEFFKTEGVTERRTDGIYWKAKAKGFLNFFRFGRSPSAEFTSSGRRLRIRIKTSLKRYNFFLYPAYGFLAGSVAMVTISIAQGIIEPLPFAVIFAGIARLIFVWQGKLKNRAKERLKDMMGQLQTIIMRRHSASLAGGPGREEHPYEPETETADEPQSSAKIPVR